MFASLGRDERGKRSPPRHGNVQFTFCPKWAFTAFDILIAVLSPFFFCVPFSEPARCIAVAQAFTFSRFVQSDDRHRRGSWGWLGGRALSSLKGFLACTTLLFIYLFFCPWSIVQAPSACCTRLTYYVLDGILIHRVFFFSDLGRRVSRSCFFLHDSGAGLVLRIIFSLSLPLLLIGS